MATPLPAVSQNSHQNGGRVFLIFVADPRTVQLCNSPRGEDGRSALGRQRAREPRKNKTSRWNAGKDLSFVPLRPERVVEVRYDHMEGERFRHTAQFNRWRRDRDPRSSTHAQLEHPLTFSLGDIVPGLGPADA
jgi:hypothetical protein